MASVLYHGVNCSLHLKPPAIGAWNCQMNSVPMFLKLSHMGFHLVSEIFIPPFTCKNYGSYNISSSFLLHTCFSVPICPHFQNVL